MHSQKTGLRGAALVLAAWLAFTPQAHADPVLVLGGEHPGFTRLVFYFDAAPAWSLERVDGAVRLTVEGTDPTFDLARAFGRIGRQRIRSLWTVDGADLEIELGCDCGARAFELGRLLVLDVTDDRKAPAPTFTPPADSIERAQDAPTNVPRPADTRQSSSDTTLSAATRALELIPFRAPSRPSPEPVASEDAAATPALTDEAGTPSVEFAEIVERLVAFADDRTAPISEPPPSDAAVGIDDPQDPGQHVAVRSPALGTSDGPTRACAPDEALDIDAWPDATAEDASPAALARSLIAEGRGTEAERILTLHDGSHPLLLDLAALVDGREPLNDAFLGMIACPGRAALWAALAGDGIGGSLQNGPSIVAAYEELDQDLRREIGPRLVAALAGTGDLGTARIVERTLGRVDGMDPAQSASAALAIEVAEKGRPSVLPEAVVRDRAVALETITDIAADLVGTGSAVPPDIAELARSLQLEQRGSPDYADLVTLSLQARMEAGDWSAALAEARAEAHRPYAGPVLDDTWRAIAAEAPDATFVALSLTDLPPQEYDRLAGPVRTAIDTRLAELGARPPGTAVEGSDADASVRSPTAPAEIAPLIDRSDAAIEASRALRDRLGPLLETDAAAEPDAPL